MRRYSSAAIVAVRKRASMNEVKFIKTYTPPTHKYKIVIMHCKKNTIKRINKQSKQRIVIKLQKVLCHTEFGKKKKYREKKEKRCNL